MPAQAEWHIPYRDGRKTEVDTDLSRRLRYRSKHRGLADGIQGPVAQMADPVVARRQSHPEGGCVPARVAEAGIAESRVRRPAHLVQPPAAEEAAVEGGVGDEHVGGLIGQECLQGRQVLAQRPQEDLGDVELALLEALELGAAGEGGVEVRRVPVKGLRHGAQACSGLGDHLGEAATGVPADLVAALGEFGHDGGSRGYVSGARGGREHEPGHRPSS